MYRKHGRTGVAPIIHRAMCYVEAGEPMWEGGPIAPHAGYITKGDNNAVIDQRGICNVPIREGWVDGVRVFPRAVYPNFEKYILIR